MHFLIPISYNLIKKITKGKSISQSNSEISLTGTIYLRKESEAALERSTLSERLAVTKTDEIKTNDSVLEAPAKIIDINTPTRINGESKLDSSPKKRYFPRKGYEPSSTLAENYARPEEFVEVHLKLVDYLLTDIDINPSMINLYPPQKPRINIKKKSQSQNFYIFNILNYDLVSFEVNHN